MKSDQGRMGEFVRNYRPQAINIHAMIHALYGSRQAFQSFGEPTAIVTMAKKFPDVSVYQDLIDWSKMRTMTDAVVIREGQNEWTDDYFVRNWAEAKAQGMIRGAYRFYDGRISPGKQAENMARNLEKDPPEMDIVLDWERSYGGAYEGLPNVVACMQRVEQLLGVKTMLYTGYYWFINNSNPVSHANQYNWLKTRPLWLAWYTSNPAVVLIPKPWTDLWFWQYGTPSIGAEYGVGTIEIDMNWFNGTEDAFYYHYGQALPDPPTGGTMDKFMKVTDAVTGSLNVRSSGANLGTQNDLGDFNLLRGDVIHVVEGNGAGYQRFDALYRNGATVALPASPTGQYWALASSSGEVWLVDTIFTPPAPAMPAVFVSHTFTDTLTFDGKIYEATFSVPNVEYKPKA